MTRTTLSTDADPLTASLIAATLEGDSAEVQRCLEAGADANAVTAAGNGVLHTASLGGSADLVRLLISHGADVNGRDKYGKTPLHCAARQGHIDIATLLIDGGADVDAMARNGSHPLDWADKFEREEFGELLRARGGTNGKGIR